MRLRLDLSFCQPLTYIDNLRKRNLQASFVCSRKLNLRGLTFDVKTMELQGFPQTLHLT